MAGIDKTYTSSWEEYQELINWAKNTQFNCPNGIIINPINYIYERNKESFNGREIPVINSSQSLDYFLIKYCPIQFVQDRMKEVYDDEYYNSIKNGTSEYDTFIRPESGTKIKMIKDSKFHNRKFFSFYNNRFNKKLVYINIEVQYNNESLWYNEDFDTFILNNELGYWTCNSADIKCKSIKAVVRKIKKWKLPKGAIVTVFGRYIGESWKFLVK